MSVSSLTDRPPLRIYVNSMYSFVMSRIAPLLILSSLWSFQAAAAAPTSETAARAKVQALSVALTKTGPGRDRYRVVDQLIELGDPAWPHVQTRLEGFSKLAEGEAIVVDLLLGFMDLSYDALPTWMPKLSDGAARRVARFVLRLKADERQQKALLSVLPRDDKKLLLQVAPALVAQHRDAVLARATQLIDDARPEVAAYGIDLVATHRHAAAMPVLVRLLGIESQRADARNLDKRRKLIHAIARLGGEAAVPPLLEALNLPDQHPAIFEGMREVGQPAVKAALFLLKTASGSRIALAMDLLAHLRHQACPKLIDMLSESNRSTRDVIIDVLTRIATEEVRPQLIDMVRARRFADVRDGIRLLATLYNDDVREVFFDLLENKNPTIRRAVIEQLWRIRDPKTFPALRLLAAQDDSHAVRLSAVKAIAGVDDTEGVELLQRLTSATDPYIRREVVEQLARVGDWKKVIPTLADLLSDPNDRVFREALLALQRLTFQSAKRRGAQWRAWAQSKAAYKAPPLPQAHEIAFRSGAWQLAAARMGSDGPAVLVVSGPPFRDSLHLASRVSKLSESARVAWMRRAPGHYRAARQSQAVWSREVDAMAKAARFRRYVLLTDTAGASFALRHANARGAVQAVVVAGGWLPGPKGAELLAKQVQAATDDAALADWRAAKTAQWRLPEGRRLTMAWRALLRVSLHRDALGLQLAHLRPLADDVFGTAVRKRALQNARLVRPARLKKPLLLVLGAKAPWSDSVRAEVEALQKAKGCKVKIDVVANSGASPLLEAPEKGVGAVTSFLENFAP